MLPRHQGGGRMIKKLENMTRDEIAALDKDKSIVLLPNSATEQHGAHLPVGTDAIILSTLVDKMVNECEFEAGNLIFAPRMWERAMNTWALQERLPSEPRPIIPHSPMLPSNLQAVLRSWCFSTAMAAIRIC